MNIGQITANLSLNIQQFMSSMRQAMTAGQGFGSGMNNWFGGANNNINGTTQRVQELGRNFKDVDRIVSGILISQAFYRATNAIQDASSATVGFMNDMSKAQISLQYFLGSAQEAKGFLMNMQDFAARTSFNTQQAVTLSRRLMGAQFDPKQIRGVMEVLNDSASATGATADQIDRIVLAMTQMKTNGKIAGQEMRQLAEAGIPIYKILQQELGLTSDQLMNIGKLHISGDIGVEAVLNGLQKRYKGAAAQIAETIPGMWETVKDDMLLISDQMFQQPYNAFGRFLRRIRDGLNKLRTDLVEHGLGGVFEDLVPPELQDSVRTIVGAFQTIIDSGREMAKQLKPSMDVVLGAFVNAFGAVAPIVAALAKIIVVMASMALQASPFVRYLAATIMTLLVAQAAAKALMFLWSITRLGVICAAVSRAVVMLADGIRILTVAMMENPWVAMLILATGWLTHVALSSNNATTSLGGLGNAFKKLGGIDIDKILQPTKAKKLTDWTGPFNDDLGITNDKLQNVGKNLAETNNNLKDTGKNAAKTGKAVKELFVSSFDEVFQIPEKVDKASKALGKGAKDIKTPKIDLSGLKDLGGLGSNFDTKVPKLAIPKPKIEGNGDWFGNIWKKTKHFFYDMGEGFKLIWWYAKFQGKRIWEATKEWVGRMGEYMVIGFMTAKQHVVDWAKAIGKTFSGWYSSSKKAIVGWSKDFGKSISEWYKDTVKSIGDWTSDTYKAVSDWTSDTVESLGTWAKDAGRKIGTWYTDTKKDIGEWAKTTSAKIGTWYTNTKEKISTWATKTATNIGTWYTDTKEKIATWATDAATHIGTWYTNTKEKMSTWSTKAIEHIGSWYTDTKEKISTWSTSAISKIGSWYSDTKEKISTWSTKAISNIGSWYMDTKEKIATWATKASSHIGTWYTDTKKKISTWATNAKSDIGSWYTDTKEKISTWASQAGKKIAGWIEDADFSSWSTGAQRIFTTFATNVDSIWKGIRKSVKGWVIHMIEDINTLIGAFNKLKIKIPEVNIMGKHITDGGSIGFNIPKIPVPHLATGGVVLKDQLVRMGEGNRREAVIPLENPSYMKPFSDAVAKNLADVLGGSGASFNSTKTVNNLNLGVLIGDERSLRELERRLQNIRLNESTRIGGAH